MSVVNVRPSLSASDSVSYALYGVGKLKDRHLRDGTTRAAAMTCSVGSPSDFVTLAHDIARSKSRKVELYSYVQSFSPTEFNVNNPADIQRVHELGVKLAERMHSADFVVVTHTDAVGGHLHNHLYVMNNDELTGKSLTRYRSWTRGLHQLNDSLMREENCEVLPSPVKAKDDWDTRRGSFAPGGFEQILGDKIMNVLADDTVRDRASFERALEAEGVRLAETHRDGLSYKMRRDTGKWGRRKASSLCGEFTAQSIEEIFNYRNKNYQEDDMKLIDKLQQESVHVEMQETPPQPPQVEETEEDVQETFSALAEFTEEQKHEIAKIYAREESQMHAIERENDMEFGQMNGMVRTMMEFELGKLAETWGVTEIDTDAALNAVKEMREKNAKNSQRGNGEKSAKPAAKTASETKPQRSEQQPKQTQVQQQKQQPKEPLSPEEEVYEAAWRGALNVIRRGETSLTIILAAWVALAKAERSLIRYRERPTPEQMREIEERDAADEARLREAGSAEALEELEYRVRRDLLKQYKRGIKQVRKQQKQAQQQQQDDGDGAPTLTPEQAEMHAAYKMNLAKQQRTHEMEL